MLTSTSLIQRNSKQQQFEYEEDSDVEVEKKDKIFRKPDRRCGLIQKLAICSIIAFIVFMIWFAYWASSQQAGKTQNSSEFVLNCKEFGVPRVETAAEFSFVIFGHMNIKEEHLRSSVQQIIPNVRKNDSIIVSFPRTIGWSKLQNAILQDLADLREANVITICEAYFHHEVWRGLWRMNLIAKDFIIFDEIGKLEPGWREWLEITRKAHPRSVLTLQAPTLPDRIKSEDKNKRIVASEVPCFAALSPSDVAWQMFLEWFDSEPDEFKRIPGQSKPGDVEDHWIMHSNEAHAGWTKSFAQFIARKRVLTIHASPALGFSRFELLPKQRYV